MALASYPGMEGSPTGSGWGVGPEKPVPSGNVHVGDIPKCDGCAFNVRTDASDKKDRGCIRKACFSLKLKAWAEAEAACVAEKAGISVVGPKEKVSILYDGSDWKKREFAQLALASKHASLRTVPVYVKPRGNVYGVSSVSGSDYVLIASTDVSALRKAGAVAPKPEKRKLEAWERRAKAQEAAKRERAKQVRALLSNAAPAFAPVIPAALQELLYRELRFDLPGRTSGETDATWRKASVDERGGMIADVLLKKHVGLASWSVPGVDVVTKKVTALAKAAGVKLPRGWDAAPSANSKPQTPKPKGAKKKR